MAFKNKPKFRDRSDKEEEETSAPVLEGLDDIIETCTNCITEIEEELDEDQIAERELDKINAQFPEPKSPARTMGYEKWELELTEEERAPLRGAWYKEYLEWKNNPERRAALAAHRARYPEFWSCFCGGY